MPLTSLNGCCASHRGPTDVGVTQLNFFSPLNTTDLGGRSRAQDGPHHATLGPGSSGACASQWDRCWWSPSSCLWVWDCCSRWPGFSQACKSENTHGDQSLRRFGAASWWAGRPLRARKHLNLRPTVASVPFLAQWKLSNQSRRQ